jgi:hypothetical protein
MTTTPSRLGLPQLSVSDAHHIGELIEEAQAGLEHAITEVRTLFQQRDLVALWDDEQGAFRPEFTHLAERYHALQRSLREISESGCSWQHDLSVFVDAQR